MTQPTLFKASYSDGDAERFIQRIAHELFANGWESATIRVHQGVWGYLLNSAEHSHVAWRATDGLELLTVLGWISVSPWAPAKECQGAIAEVTQEHWDLVDFTEVC